MIMIGHIMAYDEKMHVGKYGSTVTDHLLAVELRSSTMGTSFEDF